MIRFLACAALLATFAAADDFSYDAFKPTTFTQLIAEEAGPDAATPYSTLGSLVFHPPVRARVCVSYAGRHRPLGATNKKFLASYGKMNPGYQVWANTFEEEWLFRAEGREWWLPVQKQVAAHFAEEIKPGEDTDLYLVYVGVAFTGKGADTMLMVEEFQTPGHSP